MEKCWPGQKGFTLLEVILALALVAMLSSGLMAAYWLASQTLSRESSMSEIQYTAREVRQMILKDIHCSEKIQVLRPDGSQANPDEAGQCLRLTLPVMKKAGVEYIAASYYMENGKLYRHRFMLHDKQDPSDDQFLDKLPLSDNMTGLSFYSFMDGVVEYELIFGLDNSNFQVRGQASNKVDYSIEGI